METEFNRRASKLIFEGRLAEARALLEAAVHDMPMDWTPVREDSEFLSISFWGQEEFLAFANHRDATLSKSISWTGESYSQAWYMLAVVASKEHRLEEALFSLDRGLELEDHPELWSERGYILGRMKRYAEALECYVRAASVRDWAPASHIARALRGQGVQLIDLARFDEAEAVLRRSLELEPDSEHARHELKHIDNMRSQPEAKKREIPWFLHSFVHPPTDPLTVQLLAMVEDLPEIPGPTTLGTDDYSKISDAFVKRGWEGFEEEFERIVPRDRPDYTDVKQDLLRESLFRLKAHRNLAAIFLGKKTVEEVLEELENQSRPQKPQ